MKLVYFAWVREKAGRSNEDIALPDGITTVGQLLTWQAARGGEMATAFADPSLIRVAVNQQHAKPDQAVADGDEIAFFPPVTGG